MLDNAHDVPGKSKIRSSANDISRCWSAANRGTMKVSEWREIMGCHRLSQFSQSNTRSMTSAKGTVAPSVTRMAISSNHGDRQKAAGVYCKLTAGGTGWKQTNIVRRDVIRGRDDRKTVQFVEHTSVYPVHKAARIEFSYQPTRLQATYTVRLLLLNNETISSSLASWLHLPLWARRMCNSEIADSFSLFTSIFKIYIINKNLEDHIKLNAIGTVIRNRIKRQGPENCGTTHTHNLTISLPVINDNTAIRGTTCLLSSRNWYVPSKPLLVLAAFVKKERMRTWLVETIRRGRLSFPSSQKRPVSRASRRSSLSFCSSANTST